MDIYCKNNKCPICEKDIKWFGKSRLRCSCDNGCYGFDRWMKEGMGGTFVIFGEVIDINRHGTGRYKEYKFNEVKERIEYWREDYRYLAEILERS